jgi:mannosyltransferase
VLSQPRTPASAARPAATRPVVAALAALTSVAALLRLYGIGHQGLWFDEAYTVMLVKLPLGRMLSTIPKTESTPYLYYLLAWVWTHIVGRGAAELRALSALFGIAVVPVAYLATKRLLRSSRTGLVVAALAAFNPLLIWYSQEARAYELLVLMSACTLLAFSYARELPSPRRLGVWAAVSGLALVSHYDAALVVVPEAAWLLIIYRRRIGAWLAVAFVAACGGGLLPLLIEQSNKGNSSWIKKAPLNDRLGQILPQFLLGTGSHAHVVLMWIGFALAVAGFVLLVRRGSVTEQRNALVAVVIAIAGFALVMAVVAAGSDTLLTRNLLALWLPTAIALGAGLGAARAGRLGLAITAALCALGLAATVSVATDYKLQRPDWAALASALGPWPTSHQPPGARRLLVFQRNFWLESLTQVYMERTHKLGYHHAAARITEIDVVATSSPPGANEHWLCWWGAGCNLYPSTLQSRFTIPGFHELGRFRVKQFTIVRLVSNTERSVSKAELHREIRTPFFGLLVQHGRAAGRRP